MSHSVESDDSKGAKKATISQQTYPISNNQDETTDFTLQSSSNVSSNKGPPLPRKTQHGFGFQQDDAQLNTSPLNSIPPSTSQHRRKLSVSNPGSPKSYSSPFPPISSLSSIGAVDDTSVTPNTLRTPVPPTTPFPAVNSKFRKDSNTLEGGYNFRVNENGSGPFDSPSEHSSRSRSHTSSSTLRPLLDSDGQLFERRIVPVLKEDIDQQFFKTTHFESNDEDVVLLQVIAFILFICNIAAIVAFVSDSALTVSACVLGAIISVLGWFGASRRNNTMLKVFWILLGIWVGVLIAVLAWVVYGSSLVKDTANLRCQDLPFRRGVVHENCDALPEAECIRDCVDILSVDLLLSYSISGGLLALLLVFFVWKAAQFQRAFAKSIERQQGDIEQNNDHDLYGHTD